MDDFLEQGYIDAMHSVKLSRQSHAVDRFATTAVRWRRPNHAANFFGLLLAAQTFVGCRTSQTTSQAEPAHRHASANAVETDSATVNVRTAAPSETAAPAGASSNTHAPKRTAGSNGAGPAQGRGSSLWSQEDGELRLQVWEHDITVVQGSKTLFSLQHELQRRFDHELTELRGDDPVGATGTCTSQSRVRLLSWVGPLLGVREEAVSTCVDTAQQPLGAHPGGETRLTTFAISSSAAAADVQVARLSRWFAPRDILAALQADKLVRVGLGGAKPSDLDSLVSELTQGSRTDSRFCYSWPEDLLDRFVLHHVEGNRVAVRLGLPGAGACRNNLTELGILLPIPTPLAEALRRATDGKGGLLPASIERVPELAKRELELTFKGPL